jgi:dTDP-4-dehydrorhamnose reductase
MLNQDKILITGGSGLLGQALQEMLPRALFPSHENFDVTQFQQLEAYLNQHEINCLVHAAAFTSPPLVDQQPITALETNIIGTANLVELCSRKKIKLIYISTDYVFNGEKGDYKEDDPVYPVNKYAWSKLGGECAVRMYDNSLIIRTSFGPEVFPYPKAFIDQWTSRENVKKIALKIVCLLNKDIVGVIHIGDKRKTVYEYAKSLDPTRKIEKISVQDVAFKIPKDTSLNCEKFETLAAKEGARKR